jgi:hypothetical protein
MKKPRRRLQVGQETIRMLHGLELERAASGDQPQTGDKVCLVQAVVAPPARS